MVVLEAGENLENDGERYPALCTFAATGSHPSFQAVYICRTCETNPKDVNDDLVNAAGSGDNPMPLCICQACAEFCHEKLGHDVEYVGVGPATCDCSSMKSNGNNECDSGCICMLEEVSKEAALKLGILSNYLPKNGGFNVSLPRKDHHMNKIKLDGANSDVQHEDFPYEYQVLTIKSLVPHWTQSGSLSHGNNISPSPRDQLIQQTLEIIQHTKDTHWIPFHRSTKDDAEHIMCTEQDDLCELEKMASSIFLKHVQTYQLEEHMVQGHSGAEWWVQVKHNYSSSTEDQQQQHKNEAAIDMHYDKDERLASTFDLASFPTLSTVTYLTGNTIQNPKELDENYLVAPTLIFAHTYEMQDNGPIGTHGTPQLLISHARAGKHLVFDGRLLHGAPSNHELRRIMEYEVGKKSNHDHDPNSNGHDTLMGKENHHQYEHYDSLRVTLLVNIWLSRRPSQVVTLPAHIRAKVKSCVGDEPKDSGIDFSIGQFAEDQKRVKNVYVDASDKSSRSCKHLEPKIHLPFVSTGAAWIKDDDIMEETEVGLVVSMCPAPSYSTDTVLVCYGTGIEPCLEHIGDDYDTDEYDDNDGSHDDRSKVAEDKA